MMIVQVGSTNEAKVSAVKTVFPDAEIRAIEVDSDVLAQPIGNLMTRQGAINRAKKALQNGGATLAVGLEGGVIFLNRQCYVCNWGALVTRSNEIVTASGASIPLPNSFLQPLLNGVELSHLMREYTAKHHVSSKEGAVGIFTDGLIDRQAMYVHLCTLLLGQWQFSQKSNFSK